jgi:hypothetical protein
MNQQILTPAEIHVLLTRAQRADKRTIGPEDVEDWHDAARMQRWTDLQLCIDAVTAFYSRAVKPGERRPYLMPGDVTAYVREEARQPARFNRAELDAARPAPNEARARAIQEFAAAMARKKAIPPVDYAQAS